MSFVYNIKIRNVNEALGRGLALLGATGIPEDSRNGKVLVMPGPVVTIYDKPMERVLFNTLRDANPFFHLFESLWMLNGEQDLPWLAQFNKQMASYSDDGGLTQPAAYGFRWRRYFGYDQLDAIVMELANNPNSRRAVLAMWDGGSASHDDFGVGYSEPGDLTRAIQGSADVPCNTQCYFRISNGALHMAVTCRSNDILWGAYGANAVHFSVLLEYLAARLKVNVGTMYQFSFNYHAYADVIGSADRAKRMSNEDSDYYRTKKLVPMPMFQDVEQLMAELPLWIESAAPDTSPNAEYMFNDPFLQGVAVPMRNVWRYHKDKDYGAALAACGAIAAEDWRMASRMWIERREQRHREKINGNAG